jgi:hypothetical protein
MFRHALYNQSELAGASIIANKQELSESVQKRV